MKKTVLESEKVGPPAAKYSHGWKVEGGKLVIIAGQVPENKEGRIVSPGNFEGQVRQVFENLKNMLEAGGATFKDIVQLMVLLTEQDQWQPFDKIRGDYLEPPYPATTLFVVKSLAKPEWMVEIEAVAVVE
ncbi:MAG: RidA family protein [Planctomycetota bacterium]|jgi:enamine deaminase RidA (YjgF/YER057c/UK114 family)